MQAGWLRHPFPTRLASSGPCPGGAHEWVGPVLPQARALPLWPQLLPTFALPRRPAWPHLGMEVFSGNPCVGTRQGLGRTLSRTWQPGPPCLQRLATARQAKDSGQASGPSCLLVEARLQEVNRAWLPDPSVAPGLRPILPGRAVLSCGQLPATVTSLKHPLFHFQDAGPLCGRPGDPADSETLGEGNTAGPKFHVFSAWLGGAALKGDIIPECPAPQQPVSSGL